MDAAGVLDSPYVRICIRPRATIREIVDRDPEYMVIALVVIASLAGVAANLVSGNPTAFSISGKRIPLIVPLHWWFLNLASLVVAPLIAIAFLYVNGALLRWSGSLLGGTARAIEVRTALAWAAIPGIVFSAVNLLTGLAFPRTQVVPPRDFNAVMIHLRHLLPFIALDLALIVWAGVVALECLAEVHRFSAWRALGAWLIALFALLGGLLVTGVLALLVLVPFLK